jgi:predicted Zn-dependent peptidase
MRFINRYTTLLFAIFQTAITVAQKQTPPAGGSAKDFKLAEKKVRSLANGLRTTMVQFGEIPKVSISLIVKTGNVHEAANEVWLADLTGRMMREGTATTDFKALAKKVAGMGGALNVSVGTDQTTISGSVLSEYAADFIKVVADVAMNPAFPSSELERLKNNFRRQLSVQRAVPQTQAREKFLQTIYKGHPYAQYFPTEEMINSFTLDKVKDFYNKNFGAKRSVLYVVGKYDEAPVTAAVNTAFAKWKAGAEVTYPATNPVIQKDTVIIDRKAAPQTTILMGLPSSITPNSNDYVGYIVTNSLLGGSFGSRITTNIRENKGYTYSPVSAIENRRGGSVWNQQADVTSEHTVAALVEIEKEIARLQSEAPSKAELEGIQNYEAGIFVLRNSSPTGIINQLNFIDLYGLDNNYLDNYVRNVYSTTPEKVSEIARKNFVSDKILIVMVGDKDALSKQGRK